MTKSDRSVATTPMVVFSPFLLELVHPPPLCQPLKTHASTHTRIRLSILQITIHDVLSVASLHDSTPRYRINCLVWRDPVYARSAGPASHSERCADERSYWLIRESQALTPEPHIPSSTVDYCDGRIPVLRRTLHGSRHASSRAYPLIRRVLSRG